MAARLLQVKFLNLENRLYLSKLIVALVDDDKKKIVETYSEMGFKTRDMNEDIIYKHAKVIFDKDDVETLGGVNIQRYIEELNEVDPVTDMGDDYVMAGRVAVLLRGLGYALQYRYSPAKMWEPMARQVLKEYGGEDASGSKQRKEL